MTSRGSPQDIPRTPSETDKTVEFLGYIQTLLGLGIVLNGTGLLLANVDISGIYSKNK